jgi:hypothetical protein
MAESRRRVNRKLFVEAVRLLHSAIRPPTTNTDRIPAATGVTVPRVPAGIRARAPQFPAEST